MKHTTSFTYQNISQTKRTGKVMIYAILKVNGIAAKSRYSTGITVQRKYWKRGVARGYDGADDVNTSLRDLETQIRRLFNILVHRNLEITADILLDELMNHDASSQKRYSLENLFDDYLNKKKKVVKQKRYDTIKTSKGRLLKYFEMFPILKFSEVDADFLTEMGQKIIDEKINKPGTVREDFTFLKSAFKYAVIQEKIAHPGQFEKVTLKYRRNQIKYLTKVELQKYWESQEFLEENELKAVRWMLFASYTGLSFSDINKFNKDKHLKIIDDIPHIIINRSKTEHTTGILCYIPLHKRAQDLLLFFGYEDGIKFKFTNDPIRIMKRVNKKLEIEKRVSSKIGRSTFASLLISKKGISMESVKSILGHSSITTTERYYAFFKNERLVEEWKGAIFDDIF